MSGEINSLMQNIMIGSNEAVQVSKIKDELHQFYNYPKYYDLAFSRDAERDIEFFKECFTKYTELNVSHILEPACGPGLFLEKMPKYGFKILGYDLNPAMVQFSNKRLENKNISNSTALAVIGNMITTQFENKFDAAFICINSIGYLRKNEQILSHLHNVHNSLNEGGIYIIEMSFKCTDIKDEKKIDDTWYVQQDGISLEVTWAINWYDVENRIRHVDFQMKVQDNGSSFVIQESHDLRLWIYHEFKEFASQAGFSIVSIYNQNYEEITPQVPITGELGALFLILKKNH